MKTLLLLSSEQKSNSNTMVGKTQRLIPSFASNASKSRFRLSFAVLLSILYILAGSNKVLSQQTCLAPTVIASLPYSLASGTTCGSVNNYTTTIGGSTLYVSGEDQIYRFVPATSGTVTISVTQPLNAYLGMYLYTGCPFAAYVGGVQNNTATKSFTANVTAGTTYFLMLDTWSAPTCTAYTNLSITAPVACGALPTALTSSNVGSTSATISWTAAAPAPASGYQYFVSTSATAPTAATVPTGSTAAGVLTANLTGLLSNTTYYFWVRSNCGGSGTSNWAGSASFYTGLCIPTGTSAYTINSVVTSGGITNISNTSAGNAGYGNFTAQSASNSIGSPTTLTVTHSATVGGAGVGVWINWNNDLDFADANEQIAITTGWNYSPFTATINIPAGTPLGNYRMRVVLNYSSITPVSCSVGISGESEDYTFTVAAPPACVVPTALVSSAITSTSATISWAAASPAPASGYQYYVSTVNTAPTAATTPTGTTAAGVTSASLTGLTSNTTYYFWVRSNCGGSGTSSWAGASSFFTGFVVPTTGSNSYTTCSGTLYDPGITGTYPNSVAGTTTTLYPAVAGNAIRLTFTSFLLETCCDNVKIYNGNSTAAPLIGTYTTSPGVIQSTAADGSLTVQFTSDGSVVYDGFTATISCQAPCVPTGDQVSYGAGSWIGYVYDAATAGSFTTYRGIVTEATTFNRSHTTIAAGATAPHCSMNQDLFTIRYKNTMNLPAGYYTFSVGGDDGVRFSIDGGATWLINNWIDQGYTVSSNRTPVYLSGNTNMVFEYYENSGGAQSSFSYTYTPACSGAPTPGNTLASVASVTAGGTSNLSLQNATAPATYQWQSSASSSGPWTNIAGATGATYTATVSTSTWYQCVVTCTVSGQSANSSPVQITVTYCQPTGNASYYITNVTTTGGVTNIANATAANGGYGNFSAQSASNSAGIATNISVAHTATGGGAGVGIWIDWNNDLDFADANEQIAITTGWNYSPFAGTINIPAGTPAGNYRMRVVIDYNATSPISCPVGISGETEDYTFTVIALPPCTGTPNPGATTATSSQVFAGGSTTLGITTAQNGTGITYQWQSGASASGPWTSIGGATSATYVASPTAATYYQCIVTCSGSGASTASTPILISFNAYCNPDYTGYTTTPQNGSEGTVDGDMITNVTITGTTLNNTSTSALSSPQYTFYSGISGINMYPSNSYNVNVTAGAFTNQNFAVWIDYNDDNDFYDAGELIGYSAAATTAAYQTVSFTINLACAPPYGTHRMRVRDAYATTGSTMDPCATYGWGETEDYLVTIVPGTPFAPAFTATPTTPNCVGAQVTYTATAGQTNYAWTFPGTAGVDYTLLSGGTSTSNTAVVVYNNGGSKTITMNYASPLGCASSGAINNTITLGAGTLATTAATGDVIWRGATSVDWQTASNWYYYDGTTYTVAGSTPTTTTRTIIPNNSCVTQQPSVAAATTVNAKDVVIETGATLTMTTGTLNVNGNFTNNGTFVAGTGKVAFNAAGTVSGNATTFFDVDLNNGVNFGSALSTVNGTMTMNAGSWVNTNPPTYGNASTLKYNTGGTYGRYLEWSALTGPGYPNNVLVANNTTLNYPNSGTSAFSTNQKTRGNLTVDAGSSLYMDYGTLNASSQLTVGGDVNLAGNLSLGNQIGGDLRVGGNWTHTTGTFTHNNREVVFNGNSGNQTITKAGGETFAYFRVNKTAGNVILANNVTTVGGVTLTSGLVEVGTNNFVMGTSSLTGGSATSYVKTASTGIMSRSVGSSATTFPVGNSTYNPAIVTNAGTVDVFSLRVVDNVTADGTGVGTTTTEAVVKRTWMVNESISGGSNVTLRLYWNGSGEEINSFSPASAFIAHYISWTNMWDNIGFTGQGTGYFETNNITSFSPFTISSSTTFAPLPIELVSFQANCKENNAVAVTWTTASEHNTSHYIVEKSRDGQNWSVLGEMAAAGNSTQLLNYEMIDADKATGITYYRLTQYDNDGVFEVFNAVSVNCEGAAPSTSIMTYPNPSDNSFYVSMYTTGMKGNGQLTITDTRGTIVYAQSVNIQDGNNVFHVGDMNAAPGMYYIQVSNETTTTDIVKHSLR